MNCHEARELLSAYHDDELSVDVRSALAEHVQNCSDCGRELTVFQSLSGMAKGLDDPQPPARIWAGIEAGLDADKRGTSTVRPAEKQVRSSRKWRISVVATAATILLATGVVWISTYSWNAPSHHGDFAAAFEEFVEHFADSPQTAQNALLAKFGGESVDMAEATKLLGYRPAVARGLPAGYSLEATYVLNMPCCGCVQSICRRDDGKVFAVFEHGEKRPAGSGGRAGTEMKVGDCPCSIAQTGRALVASWKADKRQLAVVGAHDEEEITDLVDHLRGGKTGV
jgi:hypothetical protein